MIYQTKHQAQHQAQHQRNKNPNQTAISNQISPNSHKKVKIMGDKETNSTVIGA